VAGNSIAACSISAACPQFCPLVPDIGAWHNDADRNRTQYAFNVARGVWNNLHSFPSCSGVKEGLDILQPYARQLIFLEGREYLAASYPNVVNTAALHWRWVDSRQRTCSLFLTELGWRTTGKRNPYWPQGNSDPIVKWVEGLTRSSIG